MKPVKRKWKRWVVIGKFSLRELVDIARKRGMLCISAYKVPMCVHNQIGLYGTSEQMKKTEEIWGRAKHEITNREPSYAFGIDVDKPREDWVDAGKD